jgi:lipopolysaccharide assembly protein A
MRYLNMAVLAVFAAAILIFCGQNLETVTVHYLSWNMSIPLAAVALGVYVLGMASGWGVWSFLRRSVKGAKRHE